MPWPGTSDSEWDISSNEKLGLEVGRSDDIQTLSRPVRASSMHRDCPDVQSEFGSRGRAMAEGRTVGVRRVPKKNRRSKPSELPKLGKAVESGYTVCSGTCMRGDR